MHILTLRKGLERFECKFEPFEKDSKHLKQIRTIRKGFEAFESNFEQFEKDLKDSNVNSKLSKRIRSIRMQIRTIQKGFEGFECKF